MKKIAFMVTALVVAVSMSIAIGYTVSAQSSAAATDVCTGIGALGPDGSCTEPSGSGSVNSAIATAINILSWVVGVAATIVVIFGGFRYVTSGGDSAKVGGAKNAILFAIVGLVVVAMAQVIVRFTLHKTISNSSPATSNSGTSPNQGAGGQQCPNGPPC